MYHGGLVAYIVDKPGKRDGLVGLLDVAERLIDDEELLLREGSEGDAPAEAGLQHN